MMEETIMRKSLFIGLVAVLGLIGCSRNQEIDVPDANLSIFARTESPAETKTIVESGVHVYWEPGDEIAVFMGEQSAKFTTDITAASGTATFKGTFGDATWPEDLDLWAVYPFSEDAVFDGETITTTLPSEQVAREGSFGKDMNLAIAHSSRATLQFYNVGGGIRFSVTEEGIKKVMFEGLSGEIISGKVKIGFENGLPVVKEVTGGSQFITLLPPTGQESFKPGTWYYIVAIPGSLEGGYKLRFYKGSDYARKVSEKAVEIKRSIFGSLEKADSGIDFEPQTTHFPETIKEIRESEQITAEACHQINVIFSQFGFPDTKAENLDIPSIIDAICQIDGVLSAVLENSHHVITVTKNDGTIIHYDFEDGEEETETSVNAVSDEAINELLAHETALAKKSNTKSRTRKALLLSPFQDSYKIGWKQEGKLTVNKQKLEEVLSPLGYSLDPFVNSSASLEKFSFDFLSNYDLILIITHGCDPDDYGYTTLISGSEIGQFPEEYAYLYDKSEAYCGFNDEIPRYLVQPGWIKAFQEQGKKLPGSIFYVGACHSYEADDLKDYLIDNGASAYFGFDQAVPLFSTIDVIPTIDIMYSVVRSLCRGMDVEAAFDYSKIDKDLWTTLFNVYVNYVFTYGRHPWKYENFKLNPEAKNKNVFLADPRPKDLTANVDGSSVALSWKCDYALRNCVYLLHAAGRTYSLGGSLSPSISVPVNTPGTYSWDVVANVYAETTLSDQQEIVATYRVQGEPFTVELDSYPVIEIPEYIDSGYCRVGQSKTLSVDVKNTGNATLKVTDVFFWGDDMSISSNWTNASIAPGESKELIVTYYPLNTGPHRAAIYLSSNASNPEGINGDAYNSVSFDCYGQHVTPSYSKEMVDLGLSVKWAACDLGTNSQYDYGEHYAWGETNRKDSYSWENYKWCNGSESSITKYGYYDGPNVLESSDDAATSHLGAGWRIPTEKECQELIDNCIWKATEKNGIPLFEVTSRTTGKSIVFMRWKNTVGLLSDYWTSNLWSDEAAFVFGLSWYGDGEECNPDIHGMSKFAGALIRPVYDDPGSKPSISASPTSINYGNVKVGEALGNATGRVTFTNTGGSDLLISRFDCPDGFSHSSAYTFPIVISPGNDRTIVFAFKPTEAKTYSGYVQVYSNASNGVCTVKVTGNGVE